MIPQAFHVQGSEVTSDHAGPVYRVAPDLALMQRHGEAWEACSAPHDSPADALAALVRLAAILNRRERGPARLFPEI